MSNVLSRVNSGLPEYTYAECYCHNCNSFESFCDCETSRFCDEGYQEDASSYENCDPNCGMDMDHIVRCFVVSCVENRMYYDSILTGDEITVNGVTVTITRDFIDTKNSICDQILESY